MNELQMEHSSSWFAKLPHAIVDLFGYYVVLCKPVAFMSALLCSHGFVESAVLGLFVFFLAEQWEELNLLKVAAIAYLIEGLSLVTVVLIAHVSDTWTGRFNMVFHSTLAYVIGLCLLYYSSVSSGRSPKKARRIFHAAMVPIAAGRAGRFHMDAFLYDQMEQQEPNKLIDSERVCARVQFWSGFTKSLSSITSFLVLGYLAYWGEIFVESIPMIYWKRILLVSAIAMAVSASLFFSGFRYYDCQNPSGSPLTVLYRVLKAAILRRHLDYPTAPEQFYRNDWDERELLPHVALLRWLDKAAVKGPSFNISLVEAQETRRTLCPVAKVKEVKLLLTIVPLWSTVLVYSLVAAVGNIFFFQQAIYFNAKIGEIKVPISALNLIRSLSSFTSTFVYKYVITKLRIINGTQQSPRSWKAKIGVGIFCSLLALIIARFVEIHRLQLRQFSASMSIFWLTPQFCLMGFTEGLLDNGMLEFYGNHVALGLTSGYGPPFYYFVLGLGRFVGILWNLTFKQWLGEDANDSSLDEYYAILALLTLGNQLLFLYLSNLPIYNGAAVGKEVKPKEMLTDDSDRSSVLESLVADSIPTSTRRTITQSNTFPKFQSRIRMNFFSRAYRFCRQKTI